MLDFIAIDFETANPKRASVIQIGLARVRGGQIVNKATRMITPPPGYETFSYYNTQVHGLQPKDIVGAMEWPEILWRLVKYANGLPLVAHNASVERSCITQASEAMGLEVPDFRYCCTMKLAKRVMAGEPTYGLDPLIERLGLPSFGHHDAGEDAIACAHLAMKLAERAGVDDVDSLWPEKPRRRY